VPVLSTITPVFPGDPALPVVTSKAPELPEPEDTPLPIVTLPLLPDSAVPLLNTIQPELPKLRDDPDATLNVPVPNGDVPLLNTTAPLVALNAEPDANDTYPLAPDPVVPLLNNTYPLTPVVTAFALRIVTAPDDDTPPAPLTTLTTPPGLFTSVVLPAAR